MDGKKAIHPLSRKAKQIAKDGFRQINKQKNIETKNKENGLYYHKIKWFQDHLTVGQKIYTPREISRLIETYLARNDEELKGDLSRLSIRSNKIALLMALRDSERKEFESIGFNVPDLTRPKNVTYLESWDGNVQVCKQQLILKRFKPSKDDIDPLSETASKSIEEDLDEGRKSTSLRTQLAAPETSNPFAKLKDDNTTTTTTTTTAMSS